MDAVLAALNMKEGKRAWNYEDVTPEKQSLESTNQLSSLTLELLDVFIIVHPHLMQVWGETALKWACNCTVRHIACRSLQLVRTLKPEFSQRMVSDLLLCLAANISDESKESQGFALELLETLLSMVKQVEANIDLFPQMFWCSVAALSSSNSGEFVIGMKIFSVYLQSVQTRQQEESLMIYFPTKWKGEFKGLIPLVIHGMYKAETEELTIDVICAIMRLSNKSLVGENAVLFSTCANMPRLMDGFETDRDDHSAGFLRECIETAKQLEQACITYEIPQVCKLFQSYSLQRFRSKSDFLKQYIIIMRDIFPNLETTIVEFLLLMLGNTLRWNVLNVLDILLVLFQDTPGEIIELESNEWVNHLVGLLASDLAPQASRVLDALLKGRTMIFNSRYTVR
jgi:hypothetical protein